MSLQILQFSLLSVSCGIDAPPCRYARGDGGKDNSENGPTGAAYTAAAVAERERRRGLKHKEDAAAQAAEERDLEREFAVRAQVAAARGSDDDDSDGEGAKDDDDEVDSDDEFLQDLEGDPEIARIRAQVFLARSLC